MAIVSMMLSVNGPGTVPLGAIIPVGNVGAWALPASGEIKDGFALCDGTSFPSGSHPSFAGNRPNLSDSRFLQGSSSVGGTGGANSKTLATAELPAHTHSIEHDHGSVNTNTTGAHQHNILNSSAFPGNIDDGAGGSSFDVYNNATFGGNASGIDMITTSNGNHFHTVDLPNFTGTSGSVGSGTAFDIRPQYFGVVYLMRVI
jgi:microcystin-dependent protein